MKHLFYFLLLFPWCLFGQPLFTRITDANNPVVTFPNTAANFKGAVWIDLNHDHLPDLFVSQKFLFQNLGDGHFVQLPDVAGATLGQAASGSSWGDIDNDGDLDCITASTVCGLHYNNGDNTFTLQNSRLPDFESYRGWDCSLADVDNNGLLDLFFAHADGFPPGSVQQPCKLYLQWSKDTFSLVSGYEFSEQFKPYTIPVWTDFDMDGDMDLLIGSGPGGTAGFDFCYRNLLKEQGVFSLQRLTTFPFNTLQDGQVYNAIDFDNDGDLDLCLSNYAGAKTRLYRNDAGIYVEMTTPFTLQGPMLTNVWGDLDNDGDLDVLFSADGDTNLSFYRNNGGVFSTKTVLADAENGICGIALADYDSDGDLDAYTNGATTARALFRNDGMASGRHWVHFTLEGQLTNRSAIGALLRVKTTVDGQSRWQIREVSAHNSFQSQHDLRLHLGLGDATTIDSVEVRWPSGVMQQFTHLVADNFYKIVENQNAEIIFVHSKEPKAISFDVRPNPVSRSFEIRSKEQVHTIQLFDSAGKIIPVQCETSGRNALVHFIGYPPPGHYFLRVTFNNGQSAIKPLVKI